MSKNEGSTWALRPDSRVGVASAGGGKWKVEGGGEDLSEACRAWLPKGFLRRFLVD